MPTTYPTHYATDVVVTCDSCHDDVPENSAHYTTYTNPAGTYLCNTCLTGSQIEWCASL